MGSMTACLTIFSGIAGAILLGLIKDEVAAWLPRLSQTIIKISAKRLAEQNLQERYLEEWTSHSLEYPGRLSQFMQALLCIKASYGIKPIRRRYKKMFITLVLINCCTAFIIPNIVDLMFPDCSCAVETDRYIKLLALAAPVALANILFERFLEHMGWLHHRRRERS